MGCGRSWRGQKLLSILDLTPIAFWHRRLAIKLEMVALLTRQIREWPVVGINLDAKLACLSVLGLRLCGRAILGFL